MTLNPCESLRPKAGGDTESALLYAAVGHALSTWQELESGFCGLFHLFTECPSRAAFRAYAVADSPLRTGMLCVAADEFFQWHPECKSNEEVVTKLLDAYEKAQQLRKNIADGVVEESFAAEDNSSCGYSLAGPLFKSNRTYIEPYEPANYFYRREDVDRHAKRFVKISIETRELIERIEKTIDRTTSIACSKSKL